MDRHTFIKILKFKKNAVALACFSLFCLGTLLALVLGAPFDLGKFIFGLIIALLALLSSQYSNEYFDQDLDSCESITTLSGGTGILTTDPELSETFKLIALSLSALSIFLAIIFTIIFSMTPLLLPLVIGANLLCWFYTAPPVRLSYHGWGEVAFAMGYGFLIPAYGFLVFMGHLNNLLLIFTVPLILYHFAVCVNKEIPDRETDKLGSKNTLIVRKGEKFGFKLVAFSVFLASLSYLIMYITGIFPNTVNFGLIALFSLIPLPFGVLGSLKYTHEREKSLKYINYNYFAITVTNFFINLYLLLILLM